MSSKPTALEYEERITWVYLLKQKMTATGNVLTSVYASRPLAMIAAEQEVSLFRQEVENRSDPSPALKWEKKYVNAALYTSNYKLRIGFRIVRVQIIVNKEELT